MKEFAVQISSQSLSGPHIDRRTRTSSLRRLDLELRFVAAFDQDDYPCDCDIKVIGILTPLRQLWSDAQAEERRGSAHFS